MLHDPLRAGVYLAPGIPQSFRVYAANIQKHFPELGVEVVPFTDAQSLPKTADVLWDIRSGGGNAPLEFMLGGPPLVVTVHGFAPITLSGWEYFRTVRGVLQARGFDREKFRAWDKLRDGVAALIAVSRFTRSEAVRYTGIEESRIAVCHHGVEAESFSPAADTAPEPYFLHISNNEPRKNLDRVVRAFRRLRRTTPVELVLKLPEDQARHYQGIDGVRVIAGLLDTRDLAELYRRALGFIFPSLYEGFGMPILEAMASGCPVITADLSACPEVAGDAALLVNPRAVDAIQDAMETLLRDEATRLRLIQAGLERARQFDWKRSAACHAEVLRRSAGAAA